MIIAKLAIKSGALYFNIDFNNAQLTLSFTNKKAGDSITNLKALAKRLAKKT